MPTTTAKPVTSFEESAFCQRLKALSGGNPSLEHLVTATRELVGMAESISSRVREFLPQFTLHDHTHLWNVLGTMEHLAGGWEAINDLDAGDCLVAVWVAFIHDLGLVLDQEEERIIKYCDAADLEAAASDPEIEAKKEAIDWRAYREGHSMWHSVHRETDSTVRERKLGAIRADYVRESHAQISAATDYCRIWNWLEAIEEHSLQVQSVFESYPGLPQCLAKVAVSHNQDISWLPRELGDQAGAENYGASLGEIHWTWVGWLLRLADVFDCDASRTPSILFETAGITDKFSETEWRKHLSIKEAPQWQKGDDGETLLYTCLECPSPKVHKSLRQIEGWMNDEIGKCRKELAATPDAPSIPALPSLAEIEIKTRKGDYEFHDVGFHLDRDAVVELLMGESLYGGPELALRELVQNALDAVHLRDQRDKLYLALKEKGEESQMRSPRQPWDLEEPQVRVEWGGDSKEGEWITIRDNGVGMSIDSMRRFLTQIGKSYYRSPDFQREQEMMRRHGILCTAISQFGIGFLSVFMLSERVEIWSRTLDADRGTHAIIDGPHSLIEFYPATDSLDYGTTIKLWLKPDLTWREWDRERSIDLLRSEFYETNTDSKHEPKYVKGAIDPAIEIGRFIVWPLYPVILGAEGDSITIDDSFHFRDLVPFQPEACYDKAREWGVEIPEIKDSDWELCDWVHEPRTNAQISGTGSRIRIVAAQPGGDPMRSRTLTDWQKYSDQLPSGGYRGGIHAHSELQLPQPHLRYQCIVNGVRILPGYSPSSDPRVCHLLSILENLPMWCGRGCWLWIDLRGGAAPSLRADRSAPIKPELNDLNQQHDVWDAWFTQVCIDLSIWLKSAISCNQWPHGRKENWTNFKIGVGNSTLTLWNFEILMEGKLMLSLMYNTPDGALMKIFRDKSEEFAKALSRVALNFDQSPGFDCELYFKFAQELSYSYPIGSVWLGLATGPIDEPVLKVLSSENNIVGNRLCEFIKIAICSFGIKPELSSCLNAFNLD